MSTEVLIALVASLTSLSVAAISYVSQRRTQREQATLAMKNSELQRAVEYQRNALAAQTAERDARRDYEYEARKRLYEVAEPLLFQLVERAEESQARIMNLAQMAKAGNLGPRGWLSADGYYTTSTMFRLIAPLAVFRLLQDRLTVVDLSLDRSINARYSLGKILARSLTDDFEIARLAGLAYDPDSSGRAPSETRRLTTEHPERFWRQGVPSGRLHNATEALIIRGENDDASRCMRFGEFGEAFVDEGSIVNKYFQPGRWLLFDFEPRTRPILWTILVAQAHLYGALLRSREINATTDERDVSPALINPVEALSDNDRQSLNWSVNPEDDLAVERSFQVAGDYLTDRLGAEFSRS